MSENTSYEGRCFCGAVEFQLQGEPEAMAYCHCESCRHWSAGQINAFALWKPENLRVTKGAEQIAGYNGNPRSNHQTVVSDRKWCKVCGGHLFSNHPTMGLYDVPPMVIDGFNFKPAFHVHYQESVHHMHDGLPKFKDLPAEAGGTGEMLAE